MNAERWQRIKALFEEASEMTGPARSDFLSRLRERDPELSREIESLLDASLSSGDFLELPAEIASEPLSSPSSESTLPLYSNWRALPSSVKAVVFFALFLLLTALGLVLYREFFQAG